MIDDNEKDPDSIYNDQHTETITSSSDEKDSRKAFNMQIIVPGSAYIYCISLNGALGH